MTPTCRKLAENVDLKWKCFEEDCNKLTSKGMKETMVVVKNIHQVRNEEFEYTHERYAHLGDRNGE